MRRLATLGLRSEPARAAYSLFSFGQVFERVGSRRSALTAQGTLSQRRLHTVSTITALDPEVAASWLGKRSI